MVKYDRYLAELLRAPEGSGLIQTADSFFLSRLRAIDPGWKVEYDSAEKLAKRFTEESSHTRRRRPTGSYFSMRSEVGVRNTRQVIRRSFSQPAPAE